MLRAFYLKLIFSDRKSIQIFFAYLFFKVFLLAPFAQTVALPRDGLSRIIKIA
jgi:hypothetical protein